jgi:two-component system phosphate regulon response regulator PhoB
VKDEVYLVDGDPDTCRLICSHLENNDFAVRVFRTAYDAVSEAVAQPPSLFLLDVMSKGGGGFDLCRRIRRSPTLTGVPMIIVSARNAERDRLKGLNLGADDYIAKPFSPRELIARVRAVLRRFEPRVAPKPLRFGEVEIQTESMKLLVRGRMIRTTAMEFRLLEHLARHAGRVFTRNQLLAAVRRHSAPVTPRAVDVYVRLLRMKIEPNPGSPAYLKTVRGAGYLFEADALVLGSRR